MSFLWNAWYVAALACEVNSNRPLARTLLGEAVVLYRDQVGQAVALSDRCPHRFAPLHRGRIHQGVLECPYHGLRFDGSGHCVHNPHGDGRIPPTAQVRSFPLQERYGMVWIWMGEAQHAAQADLLPFEYLNPEHNVTASGYLRTRAHYQLSADNLLDLGRIGHIAAIGPYLQTFFGQRSLRLLQIARLARDDGDLRAFAGKCLGAGKPDAFAGARDQHHFSV